MSRRTTSGHGATDGSAERAVFSSRPAVRWLVRQPLAGFGLLFLPLLVIAGVAAWYGWRVEREISGVQRTLDAADANLLRSARQLDMLFFEMQKRFPPDGKLSAEDQNLLATWFRFDQTFLSQNEHNAEARYERALAHRRCGKLLAVKGDLDAATEQYQHAIALLNALSEENPAAEDILVERVEAFARLGWVLRLASRHQDAETAYKQAANLLPDERSSAYAAFDTERGFDPRMMNIYVYDNLAEWALQRGDRSQALSYRRRIIDVFRRLTVEFPQNEGYRTRLAAAEARLETMRRQPIAPRQIKSHEGSDS